MRVLRTKQRAFTAERAFKVIDLTEGNGLFGADRIAFAATYAFFSVVEKSFFAALTFGIVTPRATKIAPAEKHRRPYSGTVNERAALNVEKR